MYDFVYKNKRLIQVILALITLPFAFFGIDSYFRYVDADAAVAKVGNYRISAQEFQNALRERQEYMRQLLGGSADPAALDGMELRLAIIEGLIRQRLLVTEAMKSGVAIPDDQLRRAIAEAPVFQENGKFSRSRYEQMLRARGDSELSFESGLRRDLATETLNDAFVASSFVPASVAQRLAAISEQQREASQVTIAPEAFLGGVKLEPDAARKYYDSHQSEFALPEQARIEYVVLSLDGIAGQIQVAQEEVRQYYEQNVVQRQEARQASHILIAVDAGAGAGAKAAAKAKAEQVYGQVKQNPAGFAGIARKESQDPGSAVKGGDLGFFQRGTMVKPFDEAVFRMKVGEISEPVETQYGYHIIKLAGIRGKSFDEVKGQIEGELRKQKAGKKFAELAEQFSNLVFEQGDNLKPAAEALKLAVQQSGWLARSGTDNKLLNHPKLLAAVFSDEVVKDKRNTEAIDVGNNTLVAARVAEHKAASVRPFAELSAEIAKRLTREQAAQAASKEGRERLARIAKDGDSGMAWSAPKLVSRAEPKGLSPVVVQQIFKADVSKLPAYTGIDSGPAGYTLIKITRVAEAAAAGTEKVRALSQQLNQILAQEQQSAFVASLKQKADVEIQQERLERKER